MLRSVYPKANWVLTPDKNLCTQWTIDDGPDPVSTELWLSYLSQRRLTATFFLNGVKCLRYPELVEAIRSEGHLIGNHGYDHLDGWKTSTSRFIENFQRGRDITQSDLFRPPFGRMTPGQYIKAVQMSSLIMWSFMPGDFDRNVPAELLRSRLSEVRKNDIIVLHDSPFAVRKLLKSP